jgi:hypothetical protein
METVTFPNTIQEAIMKNIKVMVAVALAVMVTTPFAASVVKSKRGSIELTSNKDGGTVVCTADFNDELTIISQSDTKVFVKGNCGKGWAEKSKIEYVAGRRGTGCNDDSVEIVAPFIIHCYFLTIAECDAFFF